MIFGLGRLFKLEEARAPIRIETVENVASSVQSDNTEKPDKLLVGSKNGSKYHYPWCSGAKRIKEENKIWFASAEEAKRAGYTPAVNCPGLE